MSALPSINPASYSPANSGLQYLTDGQGHIFSAPAAPTPQAPSAAPQPALAYPTPTPQNLVMNPAGPMMNPGGPQADMYNPSNQQAGGQSPQGQPGFPPMPNGPQGGFDPSMMPNPGMDPNTMPQMPGGPFDPNALQPQPDSGKKGLGFWGGAGLTALAFAAGGLAGWFGRGDGASAAIKEASTLFEGLAPKVTKMFEKGDHKDFLHVVQNNENLYMDSLGVLHKESALTLTEAGKALNQKVKDAEEALTKAAADSKQTAQETLDAAKLERDKGLYPASAQAEEPKE